MKIRLHVFMMVLFLFSHTANAEDERDLFSEISGRNFITGVVVPVSITIFFHYLLATAASTPRPGSQVVAIETVKTLLTVVVLKTVWAPTEKMFKHFYDPNEKEQNTRKEKEQKHEALLSNLDRILPLVRKHLQENDAEAAIDLMANMMLRIEHLHADLDVYSGLITKDTVETLLLKRISLPCAFHADLLAKIEEKDIIMRGANMLYYRDLLEKWNMPIKPCLSLEQDCPDDYQGLLETWNRIETQEQSCSSIKPED